MVTILMIIVLINILLLPNSGLKTKAVEGLHWAKAIIEDINKKHTKKQIIEDETPEPHKIIDPRFYSAAEDIFNGLFQTKEEGVEEISKGKIRNSLQEEVDTYKKTDPQKIKPDSADSVFIEVVSDEKHEKAKYSHVPKADKSEIEEFLARMQVTIADLQKLGRSVKREDEEK